MPHKHGVSRWQQAMNHAAALAPNCQIMPAMVDFTCEVPQAKVRQQLQHNGIIAAIHKTTQTAQQLATKKTRSKKMPQLLIGAPLSVGAKGKSPSDLGAFAALGIRIAWAGECDLAHPERMLRALRYAHKYAMLVIAKPNLQHFAPNAQMHQCAHSIRLGLAGHPPITEHLAIHTLCELARASDVHIHISSLSSVRSVEIVAGAKAQGNKITADVAVSNLLYRADQIGLFNTSFKLWPPIRDKEDCEALLQGVNTGSIDCISSGHRNIAYHHKNTSFAEAAFGNNQWSNLYQSLSLLTQSEKGISAEKLADAVHIRPVSLLGDYVTSEQNERLSSSAVVAINNSTQMVQAMYNDQGIICSEHA